ncbi:hypothetical protein [Motilimonas cestriensis]|uniref:hypothetical protein n=1 Tax=Motilimonas cestriensis TaxID=2742685 RepID=UPI003DA414AC
MQPYPTGTIKPLHSREQTNKGGLPWLQTVNARLKISVIITLFSLVFIAYQGITGMQHATTSIENLYTQGMQHTIRSGKILQLLVRTRREQQKYCNIAILHTLCSQNKFSYCATHQAL